MQRLQLGDDYQSSDTEESGSKESDWSAIDDEEYGQELQQSASQA